MPGDAVIALRRLAGALLALALAAGLWLPNVHRVYAADVAAYHVDSGLTGDSAIAPRARALAADQLAMWTTPSDRAARFDAMRSANPEWDFMARTFFVLALADMALRSPSERAGFLRAIDEVIESTLAVERSQGQDAFLLPYAHAQAFRAEDGRSLFVDGEIALMIGVRQIAEHRSDYGPLLRERARFIDASMRSAPRHSGESYPDECWTFCNTTALAALRITDVVEGQSHDALLRAWVEDARRHLVDPESGLLVSSYTYAGAVKDGPEGSSIWMTARNLLLIDDAFAHDQYWRAQRELGGRLFGFGFAREWPRRRGMTDIDSGPIVPFLDASSASSGLALLGASAFGDRDFLDQLLASLELAAFPRERNGALRFAAGNALGDAVLLASIVEGPVWSRVRAARGSEASR